MGGGGNIMATMEVRASHLEAAYEEVGTTLKGSVARIEELLQDRLPPS